MNQLNVIHNDVDWPGWIGLYWISVKLYTSRSMLIFFWVIPKHILRIIQKKFWIHYILVTSLSSYGLAKMQKFITLLLLYFWKSTLKFFRSILSIASLFAQEIANAYYTYSLTFFGIRWKGTGTFVDFNRSRLVRFRSNLFGFSSEIEFFSSSEIENQELLSSTLNGLLKYELFIFTNCTLSFWG